MKITALSGVGELPPRSAAIGWTLIIGTGVAVFVATLLLKPGKAR